MKKIMGLTIISISLLMLVAGVNAAGSNLNLVLTSQTPYPAEPGSNLDIEVELQNSGYESASNIVLKIDLDSPFELLPGEEEEKKFSNVPPSGSVKASYNMHILDNATSGDYNVNFLIYTGSSRDVSIKKNITINVRGQPDLIISDMIAPIIEPGQVVDIRVKLKNIGSGKAKDIKLSFNSTDEIIPVFSKGLIYLDGIEPGEEKEAEMSLSIADGAEHKTYPSYITATYKDETNTLTTQNFTVGIPVEGTVILQIIKVEPDYERGKIKVEVANKGTGEAKSVDAKLIVNNETIDTDYISQIKANKQTTFSFNMVSNGGKGTLRMTYLGPNLRTETVEKEIVLNFSAQNGIDSTTMFAIVIIIIVVIYFSWKKLFSKKKKK